MTTTNTKPTKMDDYIQKFLNGKPFIASKTREWYLNAFSQYRQLVGNEWPPTEEHVGIFLNKILARGLKPATVDNYYRAIRAWLNWLKTKQLIEQNPIELIDPPPKRKPLPRAPHLDDVNQLFDVITERINVHWQYCRDLALFSLAIDTGARIGELAALDIQDVDMRFRTVLVKATKTHSERTLVFGLKTADELKQWLKNRAILNVPSEISAFFVSKHRGVWQPFTHWGMRQALRKWCSLAQIKQFNFNAFRHAYAIYSLRNNADLIDIQHQMGHAKISTTAIYTLVVNMGREERHNITSPRASLGSQH